MSFKEKLVIIVNENIPIGVAINAAVHGAFALAGSDPDISFLQPYTDASGNTWGISGRGIVILKGKSNEIKKALLAAKEANIKQLAFVDSMTGGTYIEQIEKIAKKTEEEHAYYAGVIFGDHEAVSAITKKLSLYK